MQVSIIIVNYNVKYFLEHCLYSVQKALRSLEAEIFVVDNASSDGSMEYLLDKFPGVNFIDNPKNIGFAKANNQALREATGEFILFLNPDTIVPEDCLERCIGFFQSKDEAGACGVKMIDGNGRFLPESKRAFPSVLTSFYKLSGLSSIFPNSKLFARYHLGHLSKEKNTEVDVLSGAFFMVRKKVLDITGGFDERFFMYGEDIDLSYRIQQAGYKNFYFAQTSIIHFKGESTKKGNLNYVKMFYKAMSLFADKHFKGQHSSAFSFLIESSIWLRAGVSATKNIFNPKRRPTSNLPVATVILAKEEEAKNIDLILKRNAGKRSIRWINPENDLQQDLKSDVPGEVIFGCESFTYKDIIGMMQQLPNGTVFSLYSGKAKNVIGSSSKDSNGYALA